MPDDHSAESDAELVARARGDDREAFEVLVRRYAGPMTALAYDRLGTVADAQDAVQEAWLTVFRRLGTLREAERFAAWAYEILRTTCAMRHRSAGARHRAVDALAEQRAGEAPLTPLEQVVKGEHSRRLRRAVEELNAPLRELIVLRYLGGAGRQEAAALLGLSQAAADKRHERAIKELRIALGE